MSVAEKIKSEIIQPKKMGLLVENHCSLSMSGSRAMSVTLLHAMQVIMV